MLLITDIIVTSRVISIIQNKIILLCPFKGHCAQIRLEEIENYHFHNFRVLLFSVFHCICITLYYKEYLPIHNRNLILNFSRSDLSAITS